MPQPTATHTTGLRTRSRTRSGQTRSFAPIIGNTWRAAFSAVRPPGGIRSGIGIFRPLGVLALVGGAVAWVVGARYGWVELIALATFCGVALLIATGFTIGRTQLEVGLRIPPQRVVVGSRASIDLTVRNVAARRSLPFVLESAVGSSLVEFDIPSLGPDVEQIEQLLMPTDRRGVVVVGPVRSRRGDPLALVSRTHKWSEPQEVFIHPRTAPLAPLGAGLLRDLEGQSSNDLSMSDLAFNSLRPYQPGDDRRFIHWRSSAKLSAGANAPTFVVRQFLDTRRSHLTLLTDTRPSVYADNHDDIETAISIVASIAVRAIRDETPTTVHAGGHSTHLAAERPMLDALSRAEYTPEAPLDLAMSALRLAPQTTAVVIVTGAATPITELRLAAACFPTQVTVSAVRVDPDAATRIGRVGSLRVLTCPRLDDLPLLVADGLLQ